MFQDSSDVLITGGTFHSVVHNQGESAAFKRLEQAVSSNAFHNADGASDQARCHPGTRMTVIERIMSWIRIHNGSTVKEEPPIPIMWLNGKAGAGKSAIARSIAEKCETAGLLLASFFFFRTDSTRNHASALIPTITYQMASTLPQSRPHVEEIISRDPLVFKCSLEAQIQALVVEPMQKLSNIPSTRLVIIDGLDECNDIKSQEKILNAIATTIHQHSPSLLFLIASRPEPTITDVFNNSKFTGMHEKIELNDSFNPKC